MHSFSQDDIQFLHLGQRIAELALGVVDRHALLEADTRLHEHPCRQQVSHIPVSRFRRDRRYPLGPVIQLAHHVVELDKARFRRLVATLGGAGHALQVGGGDRVQRFNVED